MPTWDYMIVTDPAALHTEGAIDALGAEGWELAGFDPRGVAYFKRPIVAEDPIVAALRVVRGGDK